MKIAIPIDGKCVSMRFYDAPKYVVANIVGDQIIEQTTLDIDEFSIPERIEVLIDEQVKQLICCGIDKKTGSILKKHGVKVCPSVKGEVDNVINRFINHNVYTFFG